MVKKFDPALQFGKYYCSKWYSDLRATLFNNGSQPVCRDTQGYYERLTGMSFVINQTRRQQYPWAKDLSKRKSLDSFKVAFLESRLNHLLTAAYRQSKSFSSQSLLPKRHIRNGLSLSVAAANQCSTLFCGHMKYHVHLSSGSPVAGVKQHAEPRLIAAQSMALYLCFYWGDNPLQLTCSLLH